MIALLFALLTSVVQAADFPSCERALARLEQVRDTKLLTECMDYYFRNGDQDEPPGSFNKVIRLGYRVLDVDPTARDIYSDVAWLLYSKFSTWGTEPAKMPDGEGKDREAVALFERGRRYLDRDPLFHKSAGDTIWPLAQYHKAEYYPFVIEEYERVDSLSTDKDLRVRVRLNLGHIHRKLEKKDEAIAWYRKVLELEPNNSVALKYLSQLEG